MLFLRARSLLYKYYFLQQEFAYQISFSQVMSQLEDRSPIIVHGHAAMIHSTQLALLAASEARVVSASHQPFSSIVHKDPDVCNTRMQFRHSYSSDFSLAATGFRAPA